jgi:eukaryotic-like serine/threonine-protein kinase
MDQTIRHYRVTAKVGEGGMGEVFLAQDTQLNRLVAIKLLPMAIAGDASRRRRFLSEA